MAHNYDLPAELLEAIFILLRPDPRELDDLALVCSQWYHIILRCYLLWTYIPITLSPLNSRESSPLLGGGTRSTSQTRRAMSPESSLRFAELCFQRSLKANIDLALSLCSIYLEHERDENIARKLVDLLTKYAPRIEIIRYHQFAGTKTLFPMNIPFATLKLVEFRTESVPSPPGYLFSDSTSVECLELSGNISYPLLSIKPRDLKILKVYWHDSLSGFNLNEEITRYHALEHLELIEYGLLHDPPDMQFDFPHLSSLILRDSPHSFCTRFEIVTSLSHLTLTHPYPDERAVPWPSPTQWPWPSMPHLTTFTADNVPIEDVLAVVTNCPTLVALHYEAVSGFTALLEGLHSMRHSFKDAQLPSKGASAPREAFPALEYLRINTVHTYLAPKVERVEHIVQAAKMLLEVWPKGQIAMTAHQERHNPLKQWHAVEVEKLLDHFDLHEHINVLDAESQWRCYGVPQLSEMF
ncbi:hypothetical protein DL93DRAFT_2101186 [Clavulina sp. PMI_390]|nr:hypothetical protein DL93DRAFT_2101186 [Clavulina sp. PMI_390]